MNNIFSNNPTWAIGIIILLFGIIAGHRLLVRRDRNIIIDKAYRVLNKAFQPIIEELKKRDITKSSILPTEFPVHKTAIRNCLLNLKDGSRSHTRLTEKWELYEAKYNKGKQDGMFYPSLFVDPSGESKTVQDENKTLLIQKHNQELLDIIYDILKIAKKY